MQILPICFKEDGNFVCEDNIFLNGSVKVDCQSFKCKEGLIKDTGKYI